MLLENAKKIIVKGEKIFYDEFSPFPLNLFVLNEFSNV